MSPASTFRNTTPVVSILMPVYNAQEFLDESIVSILDQSFEDYEFVIFNDGSADGSRDVILKYKDPRIVFYDLPANAGYVSLLNTGLKRARGKFIARMDADDISFPERLQLQVEFLEDNAEYGMCGTLCEIIDPNGCTIDAGWVTECEDEMIKIRSLFECTICHPSVMMRKDVLEGNNILYDKAYTPAEDYKMWYEIGKVSKLYNISSILLKYRRHDNQVSKKYFNIQRKSTYRVIADQLEALGISPTKRELFMHFHRSNSSGAEIDEWINRLIIQNKLKNIYNKELFVAYLQRWKERFTELTI